MLYDLIKSFPEKDLSAIKWVYPRPKDDIILHDLKIMADDIFEGGDNRLVLN